MSDRYCISCKNVILWLIKLVAHPSVHKKNYCIALSFERVLQVSWIVTPNGNNNKRLISRFQFTLKRVKFSRDPRRLAPPHPTPCRTLPWVFLGVHVCLIKNKYNLVIQFYIYNALIWHGIISAVAQIPFKVFIWTAFKINFFTITKHNWFGLLKQARNYRNHYKI